MSATIQTCPVCGGILNPTVTNVHHCIPPTQAMTGYQTATTSAFPLLPASYADIERLEARIQALELKIAELVALLKNPPGAPYKAKV